MHYSDLVHKLSLTCIRTHTGDLAYIINIRVLRLWSTLKLYIRESRLKYVSSRTKGRSVEWVLPTEQEAQQRAITYRTIASGIKAISV